MIELFANAAQTTLFGSIDNVTPTVIVSSTSLFPAAVTGVSQFRVLCGAEIMLVTNVASTTWTVTRGAEGTTAVTHANGAAITHVLTAGAIANLPGFVSSFNTRLGNIVLVKSDVTGTGLASTDVGAVSASGGGPEGLVISTGISGTYTPDLTRGNYFVVTITGDTTFTMPTVADGQAISFILHVFQGAGGSHLAAWDTQVAWLSKTIPILATAVGDDDLFSFLCEGVHTSWFGIHNTAQVAIGGTFLDFASSAEPANPPSGTVRLWYDAATSKFLFKDYLGNKHDLSSTAAPSSGTITQVAGQLVTGKNDAAVGSFAKTLPSAPTNGNMLVAVFGTDSTGAITPPGGWTVDKEYSGTQGIGKIGIYRKTAGAGESPTATFTFSGTHLAFMSLAEYTGQAASPVDKTASAEAHATSATATTAATAQAAELAVAAFLTGSYYSGSGAVSWASTGFGTTYDEGSGGSGSKALSATGVVSATPTLPVTEFISAIVVTYKAA